MMAEDSLTARNRINQRNFRARRQNYIKDLEERLRKYESEGVQATIEIQTAARQVTEQNVKLRSLLNSRCGITDSEIDAYLGTSNQPLPSAIFPTPPPSNLASKQLGETRSSSFQSIAPYPEFISQHSNESSILSPALGLVSLHKLNEQSLSSAESFPPAKKQKRDRSSHMSISNLTTTDHPSLYSNGSNDSPSQEFEQDTLSESSNPQTPAENLDPLLRSSFTHLNQPTIPATKSHGYVTFQSISSSSDAVHSQQQPQRNQPQFSIHDHQSHNHNPHFDNNTPTTTTTEYQHPQTQQHHHRPRHDETSCEDAARIIASMRGSVDEDRPENILLELGCPVNEPAVGMGAVKNISVFS